MPLTDPKIPEGGKRHTILRCLAHGEKTPCRPIPSVVVHMKLHGKTFIKRWISAIRNHMYWTAASSKTGPERVAKWTSLLNHVRDVHAHDDPIFPKCLHTIQKTRNKSKRLSAGTPALYNLQKELTKKTVLKDTAKLSPHYQTSSLESFHSVILLFAPKNVVYSYLGMLCRLYLAALHYNENADRGQATTSSGDPRFKLSFPKSRKGECRARPVKTEATFRNFIFFSIK
ncbi:uncharacterized protein [Misgurnus anguillicaudatus]|uniref:uncharacterized protein isoform X1 n=1 Tax=Misgurnus anguillicaudatus TaxID=75329 RepID=UPI003CCF42B1